MQIALLKPPTFDVGREHVEDLSLLSWESFYENLWRDLLTLPLPLGWFPYPESFSSPNTEKCEGCEGGERETAVRLARIIRHVGDYYTLSGFTTPGGREGEAMQWTAQSEVYIQIIACDD